MKQNNKILIIGCGSVSQALIPLLLKMLDIIPSNIIVIDFVDNRHRIKDAINAGVQYIIKKITPDNIFNTLSEYIQAGDILIDLSIGIDTYTILEWCFNNQIRYIDSSFENWSYEENNQRPISTYARVHSILNRTLSWDKKGPTCILIHGANPGLITHFAKQGLVDIACMMLAEKNDHLLKKELEKALSENNVAQLAYLQNIKVIHISERDTQTSTISKKTNHFINTWSPQGFISEATANAEVFFGNHEPDFLEIKHSFNNYKILKAIAKDLWARSWVPSGEFFGMVIPHEEIYEISLLLLKNDFNYHPSLYFVYLPNNITVECIQEYSPNPSSKYTYQIINNEILHGSDELGCLFMSPHFSWWTGTVLSITESRNLISHQNATTVQVAIGLMSALIYMIENPHTGINFPYQLDSEKILDIAKPYLGTFISQSVDWKPLEKKSGHFFDFLKKEAYE